MKWWSEIWLNEGFATYMSTLALDEVEPTFKVVSSELCTGCPQCIICQFFEGSDGMLVFISVKRFALHF